MHIAFFNPQGNFDSNDSFWTKHPDFGGQLVYVKELAVSMAQQGNNVDIITRKVIDDKFPQFNNTFDYYNGVKNLRIIRIPCGPNDFLAKEKLWSYLYEWVDNIISFYNEEGDMPDFVTTHYGDGGISGALFKEKTNIPFSFTGHSLGAQKIDKLHINDVRQIDIKYNFSKRITAERIAMLNSSIIFVSTAQERDEQYKHQLYAGAGDKYNPEKFKIVVPGVNTRIFKPIFQDIEDKAVDLYVDSMLKRDISEDRKSLPAVISSSRLDLKKNHIALVKAYAESVVLQEKFNLIIILNGIENAFKDYSNVSENEKNILDEIMGVINKFNLRGKISMFSIDSQRKLAAFYRKMAERHSVFALTSTYEPFGLAPLEAMSCGLPAAVTKYGGPKEVLYENGIKYGELIDVFDISDIQRGILSLSDNYKYYRDKAQERINAKYTWNITARGYLDAIRNISAGNFSSNIKLSDYDNIMNDKTNFERIKKYIMVGD